MNYFGALDEFLKKNTPVMRYYIYLKEDYRPNDDISASYFIRTPAAGKDLNCIEIELKKAAHCRQRLWKSRRKMISRI